MRLRFSLCASVILQSIGLAAAQQYQAVILQSPDTIRTVAQGISSGVGAGSFYTRLSGPSSVPVQLAMYWPDPMGPAVVLQPSDAAYSYANAYYGGQIGGAVNSAQTGGAEHAALWFDGSPDHYLDLHPSGFLGSFSAVLGMDVDGQVGYAQQMNAVTFTRSYHPILWHGTASSAVDLYPNLPGLTHAIAASTAGGQQAGWIVFNDFNPFQTAHSHAYLWTGTADSGVDLHPDGYFFSAALGTDGAEQVGYAYDWWFRPHAMMWTGSAASATDLTPPDFSNAKAFGCRNGYQVGYVVTDSGQHAAIWHGSPDSFINLDDASNSGFTGSVATGIDDDGNIVGYTNNGQFGAVAVMWKPVRQVQQNQPPVADAGADQTVECQGANTQATLDGSASYDPDNGDTLTYQWTDENNQVVGSDAIVTVPVGMGSHAFTLVVTDNHGAASQPSATHVTVQDTTPPTISGLSANPNMIWPPNKQMITVTVSYSLSDNCDSNPSARLSVACNEPVSAADMQVLDPHHVRLRADRLGKGFGRTYTITVRAQDDNNNASSQSVTVSVPHDKGS